MSTQTTINCSLYSATFVTHRLLLPNALIYSTWPGKKRKRRGCQDCRALIGLLVEVDNGLE